MTKSTILVVDDDESILELVEYNLVRENYMVLTAANGEQALKIIRSKLPSLIILDLMLPGMSGLDICRTIKGDPKTDHIPVVILTAKGEETDIVTGLELGADDYITKPFSPKVLIARIRRQLRKKVERNLNRGIIKIHKLTIDPTRHEASINGEQLKLTFTEFNILYILAKRPGMVFSRYQIVDALHGEDYLVTDRSVDVQIAYLRKKLKPHQNYIETVRGVGYRFKDAVTVEV